MRKSEYLAPFLAGLGLGVAASVLLAPEAGSKTRGRIRDIASRAGDAVKAGAEHLGAAEEIVEKCNLTWREEHNERSKTLSDMKDKAKEKIDDAADAAKNAAGRVIDKSTDVAHSAGEKMEEGGKRLQDA
jgi:gas vesicle protein